MNELLYKIWFVMLPMNPRKKILLKSTVGDYIYIYENREMLFKKEVNYLKLLEISPNSDKIKKIEESLKKGEFGIVIFDEKNYPKKLKEIEDMPFSLFYKGKIELVNDYNFIAVVGARKLSEYGLEATKEIVNGLVDQNVGLVSGGAKGVDSVAHRTALNNNIFNVIILGCGIDVIYPKENKQLFDKILEYGVMLSEYLPGAPPLRHHFPYRNRIISGISSGVVVTEASIKSGASRTAAYASEQGREVIAVPGSIYSELSKGCNKLILDGAKIYDNVEDIFFQFNINYVKKRTRKEKCNGLKLKILKILEENPKHIEEIRRETNVDISMINELLFEMQFNNEIIGLTGNYFAKIL